MIGFQRAVVRKALGEPTQSGVFKPNGGEPSELFGVSIEGTYDDCVAEWGEPLSVTEDKAGGFMVPEWQQGGFKISGEFWLEAVDDHKKGAANSISVTRAAD